MRREGVPEGGFVFVSATGLLAAWWAYKRGLIQFRDFRVWLASHEMVAQRCVSEKGRIPRFEIEEFGALVGGVGGEHFRASVRRLTSLGLMRWSEHRIEWASSLASLQVREADDLEGFVQGVTNHRRRVPVPRRLLRVLTSCSRPVLVATALGHLLRCMYYRNHKCSPSGLCKASWIATTLEVDERNVKAARQELESLGILIREPASQYRLNRWGVPMRFNLDWCAPSIRRQSPPRNRQSTTETPPPRETENSSFGRSENQKPARPAPGVRKRTGRGPSLRNVTELDLADPRRTLELHRQAAHAGLVGTSESERLKVLALAAHAREHAKRNAPGLFVTVLRQQRWEYLTLRDEDSGRKALAAVWEPVIRGGEAKKRPEAQQTESRETIRSLIARSLGILDVVG